MQIINSEQAIANLLSINPYDRDGNKWSADCVLGLLRLGKLAAIVEDGEKVYLYQRLPEKARLELGSQPKASEKLVESTQSTSVSETVVNPEEESEIVYRGGAIASNDNNAVALLKSKLKQLENCQSKMKSFNKLAKKNDTEAMLKLGYSEAEINKLLNPQYSYQRVGYQSYELSNNNQTIRSVRERIEELEHQQNWKSESYEVFPGLEIEESVEDNRIRLKFDQKPSKEVRTILKTRGFKWSPRNTAWQRMLNGQGITAVQLAIESIKELNLSLVS